MRKLRLRKIIFPVFVTLLFLLMSWVVMSNYATVAELRRQGNQPATTVATPLAGKDGAQGIQGERGEKGDTGFTGATGAQGAQGERGVRGEQGVQGVQGVQGAQGDKGDKGDTGATGANGANGTNGSNGRTPEMSCVIRWDVDLPTVTRYWVAWKYTDEDNTHWRNISRINSADRPPNCLDLRTT